MAGNNAVCVTCGKAYTLCRKCDKENGAEYATWHASCDTPECFQVLLVLNEYYYDKISKEEAYERLSELLTEDMRPYHEAAAGLIHEIMGEEDEDEAEEETEE